MEEPKDISADQPTTDAQGSDAAPKREPANNTEGEHSVAPAPNNVKTNKTPNGPLIVFVVILTALVTTISICIAILLLSQKTNISSQEDDVSSAPVETEPVSMDELSLKFLQLEKENGKNIVYSPLSIKYALAMLSDAADGESKAQIDNLVGNLNLTKYTNNDKQSLANAMFVRDTKMDQVLDSYAQTLDQKYAASVVPESFTSEAPLNDWVSLRTFGLINNLFNESVLESDFVLVNALAIDMNWNNQLQCAASEENKVPCMRYGGKHFAHENYTDTVNTIYDDAFSKILFGDQETKAAQVAASANKYNIIEDLGEDYIRSTVQSAYDEWLAKAQEDTDHPDDYDTEFNLDKYMEELKGNYGKTVNSTDFYFADTESEKVFAKDLQTNNGSTLQYVGIMPKSESLDAYIDTLSADKLTGIVGSLNNVSTIAGFKDGVVTKVSAYIPFFNFNYDLRLKDDLNTLGITDVFESEKADLSRMTSTPYSYIQDALHKADIDFSNDGIRAAAATAIIGGFGAGGKYHFEYDWDIPVEEIDLTFDRPFFFIIHDKTTGEVWFTGSVYSPTK